jgi:hypothetical protein
MYRAIQFLLHSIRIHDRNLIVEGVIIDRVNNIYVIESDNDLARR